MPLLKRNIETTGRIVRGAGALILLIAAFLLLSSSYWASGALFFCAAFLAFEALRGWCALRACGVRTKF